MKLDQVGFVHSALEGILKMQEALLTAQTWMSALFVLSQIHLFSNVCSKLPKPLRKSVLSHPLTSLKLFYNNLWSVIDKVSRKIKEHFQSSTISLVASSPKHHADACIDDQDPPKRRHIKTGQYSFRAPYWKDNKLAHQFFNGRVDTIF